MEEMDELEKTKKNNYFLLGSLFLVLVIAGGLIILYLYKSSKFVFNFPFLSTEKHFTEENKSPQQSLVVPKIIQGDISLGVLTVVELTGKIKEDPFVEAQSRETILPVLFTNKSNKVEANLVIGDKSQRILSLYASTGSIPSQQEWVARPVEEISQVLKKGNSILVEIYYDKPSIDIINRTECKNNPVCQKLMNEIKKLADNNSNLVKLLQSDSPVGNDVNRLKVGPISRIVIYK